MGDLLDYIAWRGDLTLDRDGFNEVDAAILARYAYVPFEDSAGPAPIEGAVRELAGRAPAAEGPNASGGWLPGDHELLTAMGDSARFGGLETGDFVCRLDEKLQTQFSAVTVKLSEGLYCIAFRGTDNTLVGWKEDMNMSYLCPIPGQEMAADYVRRAAERLDARLILTGHSKGGNLAVYAGAFCGEGAQGRIDAIYNFDGPGFFEDILQRPEYRRVCGRIHTYVPQFSVVGMLLNREEEQTVVHSTGAGIMQHDPYTWEVLGRNFVYLERLTEASRLVAATVKDWIADMTPEQFERFAGAIYTVFSASKARSIPELRDNWLDAARGMVHTLGEMDEDTRALVQNTLHLLAQSAGHEVRSAIKLPSDRPKRD